MSAAWLEILIIVAGSLANFVGTWFVIKWRVNALERGHREDHHRIEKLERHFAAYTGMVNGVKYREEH